MTRRTREQSFRIGPYFGPSSHLSPRPPSRGPSPGLPAGRQQQGWAPALRFAPAGATVWGCLVDMLASLRSQSHRTGFRSRGRFPCRWRNACRRNASALWRSGLRAALLLLLLAAAGGECPGPAGIHLSRDGDGGAPGARQGHRADFHPDDASGADETLRHAGGHGLGVQEAAAGGTAGKRGLPHHRREPPGRAAGAALPRDGCSRRAPQCRRWSTRFTTSGRSTAATGRSNNARTVQRGSSEGRPVRKASTSWAHWRPSRIAQTTRDWPRRMSPAAKTLSREVR